jgi:hypothetical protein
MAAGEPAVPSKKVNYFIKDKKDAAGMSQDFSAGRRHRKLAGGAHEAKAECAAPGSTKSYVRAPDGVRGNWMSDDLMFRETFPRPIRGAPLGSAMTRGCGLRKAYARAPVSFPSVPSGQKKVHYFVKDH